MTASNEFDLCCLTCYVYGIELGPALSTWLIYPITPTAFRKFSELSRKMNVCMFFFESPHASVHITATSCGGLRALGVRRRNIAAERMPPAVERPGVRGTGLRVGNPGGMHAGGERGWTIL